MGFQWPPARGEVGRRGRFAPPQAHPASEATRRADWKKNGPASYLERNRGLLRRCSSRKGETLPISWNPPPFSRHPVRRAFFFAG